MSALPSESPRPAPTLRRPWTAREDALLRKHYDGKDSASIGALCATLRRPRVQLYWRAQHLGLTFTMPPRWTDDNDDFLRDEYASMSVAAIAERLGRTEQAIQDRAYRLGIRRKEQIDGFTTAELAQLMGRSSWREVRDRWIYPGHLRAHRTKWSVGRFKLFVVREADFLRFLRECPHLYDWRTMHDPSGYYQRIAREAWDAAQLLTTDEVAARLGVTRSAVCYLLRKGQLPYLDAQREGCGGTRRLIRAPDLAAFLDRVREHGGRRGVRYATAAAEHAEPALLTVAEAGERTKVSQTAVRWALEKGRLVGRQMFLDGHWRWFIRASDLAAYQAAREQRKAAKHGDD